MALGLGVCPAAAFISADGFCDGKNGGRACSFITGTLCGNQVQGTILDKRKNCEQCDFFKKLKTEHGDKQDILAFAKHVLG